MVGRGLRSEVLPGSRALARAPGLALDRGDTFRDFEMARNAFAWFETQGTGAIAIRYPEMVALLDRVPEIVALNQGVEQKQLVEG